MEKRIQYSANRFFSVHKVKVIEYGDNNELLGVRWFSNFMTAAKFVYVNCPDGIRSAYRYKIIYPDPKDKGKWMKAQGDEIIVWIGGNWVDVWTKGSENLVMEGTRCLAGEEREYDIHI